jgi:hypothetical protein
MNALSLAAEKYKVLAGVVLLAILLVCAGAAGAVVNGWRLDAAHQKELAAKDVAYEALAETVREQNRGVAAMKAATDAAEERRQVAKTYAADVLRRVDNKAQAVANSKATTCDGVLQEAWRTWK